MMEWVLLAFAGGMLTLANLRYTYRTRQMARILSFLSIVAAAIHGITEGFRAQMILIYFMILLISVVVWIKKPQQLVSTLKSWVVIPLVILSLLGYTLSAALPIVLPVFSFDKPTGSYTVGTTIRYVTDPSREETFTADPNDHRELLIQIWYPSSQPTHSTTGNYGVNSHAILKEVEKDYQIPAILLSNLEMVKTYSTKDAPISTRESAYPVLLFSHGLSLYGFQNTYQMEELASHGFIVVAIQHTYNALLTVLPDGRKLSDQPINLSKFQGFIDMNEILNKVWVKDAGSVLDYLQNINLSSSETMFKGKLDMLRVGMLGHSFGGAAAAQTLFLDSRVKAAINLDGTLFGTVALPSTSIPKPFMQISADVPESEKAPSFLTAEEMSESDLKKLGATREEYAKNQDFLTLFSNNSKHALNNHGYQVWIKGVEHYTFSDIPLYSPLIPLIFGDRTDTKLAHRIINDYTLAFFEKTLKQTNPSLLNDSKSPYPEAALEIK